MRSVTPLLMFDCWQILSLTTPSSPCVPHRTSDAWKSLNRPHLITILETQARLSSFALSSHFGLACNAGPALPSSLSRFYTFLYPLGRCIASSALTWKPIFGRRVPLPLQVTKCINTHHFLFLMILWNMSLYRAEWSYFWGTKYIRDPLQRKNQNGEW